MEREQLRSSWRKHYAVRKSERDNSSDFVIYFPYDCTEMEVGRKHIHVLTDSYEIWQKHFVRKIPKGQRSHAEAAGVQVSGSDLGSDDEIEQEEGEVMQKSRKKWIVLTLTPLSNVLIMGF